MNMENLGPAVLDALNDSEDLKALADQLGEIALDEFLDEGLAKNVPVLELLRKISKATASYSNYLLTKKLILFLSGLSSIPLQQRRQQIARLTVDVKHRQQVGENLMLLLDRLNDIRKPLMLARAWKAYLEARIDRSTLFQLNHAIDQIHVEHIPILRDLYRGQTSLEGLKTYPITSKGETAIEPPYHLVPEEDLVDDSTWQRLLHLAMCGLLDMLYGRGGAVGGRRGGLRLNTLGQTFVEIVVE